MTTHFLSRDFSLANIPTSVDQHHYDNFEAVLRQRDRADDALQDARDVRHELGSQSRGAVDRRRLRTVWERYHDERERYDAMVQDAMEQLTNDYPYGFGEPCW